MINKLKSILIGKLNGIIDKRIDHFISEYPKHLSEIVFNVNPKLKNIDYRINRLNQMLLDIYPENLILTQNTLRDVKKFLNENGFSSNLDLRISKNDLMFQYNLLQENGDFSKAVIEYLRDGIESLNIIKTVCKDNKIDIKNIDSFLDFASGYGKLERFLVNYIDPKNIWVSDVKEKANEFVAKTFGVNSLNSSFNPREFVPERKFQFVFVGSLFSHLNEALFEDWLMSLYELVEKNGFLVISLHDISLLPDSIDKSNQYVFYPNNEDVILEKVEDSIEDTEKYGTSYYSEEKVRSIIKNSVGKVEVFRYEKALWGTQDVYVLFK